MPKLELSTQQKAELLHKSKTQKRQLQKQYHESLGGNGSAQELDATLSLTKHDADAMRLADSLQSDVEPVSQDVSQAVNFFLHSLISGEFGPDDSRDGRSDVFLKRPHVVAKTTEVFVQRLAFQRSCDYRFQGGGSAQVGLR